MKTIICPTVTAEDLTGYGYQMRRVSSFAKRIHIDLMDGDFAPSRSPALEDIWWPHHVSADIHLMYRYPMDYVDQLIQLKPRMVIVQAEAAVHHMHFAAELHKHDILAGLCILQETPVVNVKQIMHSFDQLLIFSGHLGYHGGVADLGLLHKAQEVHDYYPEIQLAWDGGINAENAPLLKAAGIRVLNVGGFVQHAENPEAAYGTLKEALKPSH